MIKRIYGLNIAVKDLEAAKKTYESFFGVKAEPMGADSFAFPGLIGAKLNVGGLVVHLISYSDENTSVAKFVNSKGDGFFLLSVEVDNIDQDVAAAREKGLNVLLPETAKGDFGAANFIHPKSMHGVQFELYQPKP
ncbi:MAG: VOC family protein [Deltaproteobacteria bacterium]|nr:VOC family protein [Deltaproteobacteria bacterium]